METKEKQEQARVEGLTRLFRKTLHLLEQAIAAITLVALFVALGVEVYRMITTPEFFSNIEP